MTFRLLQISDCHLFADAQKCGYADINPLLTLNAVLDSAENERPNRILITGDVSGDSSAQSYQHLYEVLDSRGWLANTRMIPGNHDEPSLMTDQFGDNVCRLDSFEDVEQWRFHYLNSHYEGTKGVVEKTRLDALEHDILQAPEKHHVVAVHHHPLDCIHWMDKHDWVNRDEFLQRMYFMPKPVRVLYGHVHHAVSRTFSGQEYYACPSTCWQWAQTEQFGVSDVAPGYRMMELGDNGDWQTWVNRIEWSVEPKIEA